MPKSPLDPRRDPMAREVDRLLAGLATLGAPAPDDHPSPRPTPTPRPASSRATPRPARRAGDSRGARAALWARLALGVALGGLMTQWPYPHACDLPLLAYLGAVAMVMVAGTWIALVAWTRRHGPVHILALALFFWGIVLAAVQVLPRVGYAAERWAWRCG